MKTVLIEERDSVGTHTTVTHTIFLLPTESRPSRIRYDFNTTKPISSRQSPDNVPTLAIKPIFPTTSRLLRAARNSRECTPDLPDHPGYVLILSRPRPDHDTTFPIRADLDTTYFFPQSYQSRDAVGSEIFVCVTAALIRFSTVTEKTKYTQIINELIFSTSQNA